MKRFLAIAIALSMALSIAACGGAGKSDAKTADGGGAGSTSANAGTTAEAQKEEPMEISMMNWNIADSFPEDGKPDKMWDYVRNKFNIVIKPFNVTWEDVGEKRSAWAAAGTLPEVIGATAMPGSADYYQWISDGVVRPIPDNLSAYPHVKKFMEQPEVTVYAVDGKNYLMPRQTYADSSWMCMDRGILSRKDWRENLGLSIPKTEQEFIDMCVAFATQDPDGNGVDDTYGYAVCAHWALPSFVMSYHGNTDGGWHKLADGKMVIPALEKTSLPLMSFYRRMYAAGAFDPDFATDPYDEGMRKFSAGKVGILGRMVSPTEMRFTYNEWNSVQKDKDFVEVVEVLPPPEVPGNKPMGLPEFGYWSETYINKSVDDVKMAKILEFYDYFYSEEGMRLLLFGFEGEDYKMEGDEIIMLTEISDETGFPKSAADIYPYAAGGMIEMVAWAQDYMQYIDPTIPKKLRETLAAERDRRLKEYVPCPVDLRIAAINIPEQQEMSGVSQDDGWIYFIMNTDNISDSDLFDQIYADWEANGYKKAKDAMTKKVAELGY